MHGITCSEIGIDLDSINVSSKVALFTQAFPRLDQRRFYLYGSLRNKTLSHLDQECDGRTYSLLLWSTLTEHGLPALALVAASGKAAFLRLMPQSMILVLKLL